MTNHHETLARQAVEQFRQSLGDAAREHITDAQFEDLTQLIHRLLSNERGHIADLMEAVARTLRSGTDRPELEL
ncbi:MAG: hypothetical protein R3308_00120 [Thiohalobacterales bacterium]|nr:hypothetical protein [Thiohalobacterales bacterium]